MPIIYLLDPSVAVTGAFVAARNMARALKDEVRMVLVLPSNSTLTPNECADFWRIEHVPVVSLAKHWRALVGYVPALLRGTMKLHAMMRADGAEQIILNDFYLMHGSLLRALGFRGRIISFVRCNPAPFAGPLARPMLALMARSANRCIAVSRYVQGLLPNPAKVQVLYDYYAGAAGAPRSWTLTDAKPFVYVGNYIPGKGQDVALEAFAIASRADKTLTLHFCGGEMGRAKNHAYRQQLEARAAALGLAQRVVFHGFMADTSALLEQAYAALNFSRSESFSMTVLEASGAGLPVIATRCGGPEEILVEGVTGMLIPIGDIQAAAEAITTLAADPARAEAMGRAGAAHVATQFTRERFTHQLRGMLTFK